LDSNSSKNNNEKSPYEILGVKEGAAFEDIQKARDIKVKEAGEDLILKAKIESSFDQLLMGSLKARQSGNVSYEAVSASKKEKQINQYMDSFVQLNSPIQLPLELGEERLLLPPNLDNKKVNTVQSLLRPILERGKANADLENRDWTEPSLWPDWTISPLKAKYAVIAEIVANLLENAFKYAQKDAEIGLAITSNGLCILMMVKK